MYFRDYFHCSYLVPLFLLCFIVLTLFHCSYFVSLFSLCFIVLTLSQILITSRSWSGNNAAVVPA